MEQELIQLIKLLGTLPNSAILALFLFLMYKTVLYLASSGVILFLGKEIIKKFPLIFFRTKNETVETDVFYHALIQNTSTDKKEWFYNRESLKELSKLGIVKEYYSTPTKVNGYMG